MLPDRARELLADHVRGRLDAETSREVEAALAGSEELRREAASLRSYYAALDGMTPDRAPSGFLAKVNECIDRPPLWRRLARAVFLPFHIKLPMELAGLAATAVLLVVIIDPFGKRSIVPRVEEKTIALREVEGVAPQPPAERAVEGGPEKTGQSLQRVAMAAAPKSDRAKAEGAIAARPESEAAPELPATDKAAKDEKMSAVGYAASQPEKAALRVAQDERRSEEMQAEAKSGNALDLMQTAGPASSVKAAKATSSLVQLAGGAAPAPVPASAPMLMADSDAELASPPMIGTLRIVITEPLAKKARSPEMLEKREGKSLAGKRSAAAETAAPPQESVPVEGFADLDSLLRRHHANFTKRDEGALRTYDVRMRLADYRSLRADLPAAWVVAGSIEIPASVGKSAMVRVTVSATR